MRELKFRAFDTENKTWTFVTLGDLICGACTENGDKPLSGAKQIWEQYTGFKDKNDKEIYEGDIIVDFDEFISVVDGNCAVISEKTCREKYFDEDDCLLERRIRPLIWVVNDYGYYPEKKETQVEIIGNIHENPELLEDKK